MSIFQILENFFAKNMFCDHKSFLWCEIQNFNLVFVTIFFSNINAFDFSQ
jgi:hypothetical protein